MTTTVSRGLLRPKMLKSRRLRRRKRAWSVEPRCLRACSVTELTQFGAVFYAFHWSVMRCHELGFVFVKVDSEGHWHEWLQRKRASVLPCMLTIELLCPSRRSTVSCPSWAPKQCLILHLLLQLAFYH